VSTVTARLEGLDEWIDSLENAAETLVDEIKPVVSKGALNIKTDWRAGWKTLGPHITDLPRKITYDVDVEGTRVSAEIGPDKELGGQAPLANVIEYGSVNNAPHPAGAHALAAEEPRFLDQIADATVRLLEKR